jgi:hypothetical protein
MSKTVLKNLHCKLIILILSVGMIISVDIDSTLKSMVKTNSEIETNADSESNWGRRTTDKDELQRLLKSKERFSKIHKKKKMFRGKRKKINVHKHTEERKPKKIKKRTFSKKRFQKNNIRPKKTKNEIKRHSHVRTTTIKENKQRPEKRKEYGTTRRTVTRKKTWGGRRRKSAKTNKKNYVSLDPVKASLGRKRLIKTGKEQKKGHVHIVKKLEHQNERRKRRNFEKPKQGRKYEKIIYNKKTIKEEKKITKPNYTKNKKFQRKKVFRRSKPKREKDTRESVQRNVRVKKRVFEKNIPRKHKRIQNHKSLTPKSNDKNENKHHKPIHPKSSNFKKKKLHNLKQKKPEHLIKKQSIRDQTPNISPKKTQNSISNLHKPKKTLSKEEPINQNDEKKPTKDPDSPPNSEDPKSAYELWQVKANELFNNPLFVSKNVIESRQQTVLNSKATFEKVITQDLEVQLEQVDQPLRHEWFKLIEFYKFKESVYPRKTLIYKKESINGEWVNIEKSCSLPLFLETPKDGM